MIDDTIRIILKSQIKYSRRGKKTGGFTLIELLVGIIMAALVITPLLGFMINILSTDRQEQAKSNSQQEIQSALGYITRDLEQAVYIYDGKGIGEIKAQLPYSGDTTKSPVLVFWKRKYLPQAIQFNPQPTQDNKCPTPGAGTSCNDAFVYSLVAYYLIQDKDTTWSTAARIGRFELQDGVRDPVNISTDPNQPNYLKFNSPYEKYNADTGFKIFDLNAAGKTLEEKMNKWESGKAFGSNKAEVLIDYIDQTPTTNNPAPPTVKSCQSELGLQNQNPVRNNTDLTTPPSAVNSLNLNSFYACVDVQTNTAKVYLRGNALARIQNDAKYKTNSIYFPEATITVKGRGFLFTQ